MTGCRDTQVKVARLYPDVASISLDDARICLDCDLVHDGCYCPACASGNFMELSAVIGRMPQNSQFSIRRVVPAPAPVSAPAKSNRTVLRPVAGNG